jgi:hypothetical protein
MSNLSNAAKKSPVTTWGGVIAALGAFLAVLGEALGKPQVAAVGLAIGGIGSAVLGVGARDHSVSPEQAGAKGPEVGK